MVKIIIINDNKQLDLKGNEKTIEDIKDTLSTYYGYIRSNILFFLDKECTRQFKDNIKFSSVIEQLTLFMKYNKEEDDDNSSLKSKNDENIESESDSYPKDLRKVVEQINQKEEKKNKYLNNKRYFEEEENKPEKYNVNTGELASDFLTDKEELYDILNSTDNIYVSIISEDEMKEKRKNNKNIFNYNEFKKKNNVKEPILNLEDLLNYLDKNTQKGQKKEKFMEENKQNEDEQIYNQNNNFNNNYDDDYFYDINKIDDQNINYEENIKNEKLYKKIECGKILKNSFVKCNKKILNINERKQLKDIINTLDLENNNYGNIKNIEQEKINLILDLDNTIIFSFLDNQKLNREKVNNKINEFKNDNNRNEKIYNIDITINMMGKTIDFFTFFKFRNGTEEFFKKLKPFCNFYVYSNGAKEYVYTIVQQIEKTYDIEIIKFLYRNEFNYNKKNFNDFEIDYSKSIIIDDRIDVWQHYFLPKHCQFPSIFLLPSKKYYDNRLLEKSFLIQKNQLKGFHIIVNRENDWRIPVSYILDDNYFLNKDSIPLNLENENDKKFQLIYLSKVIKKIVSLRNFWVYYIEKESNLKSSVLINLIRHTVFSNKIFDTSYLFENNLQNKQKNIIKSIIESLGGEVYDSDDIYSNNNITHYLIGLNLNDSDKKKLKNIKKFNNSLFFVNAKYIFDCYYFLTELNENDEEYKINI